MTPSGVPPGLDDAEVTEPPDLGVTTSGAVLRGGLWSVLGRVLPQIQVLAISIVAARFLGPDGMGRQSYIAFVASSVSLLAVAGLPSALTMFVGQMLGARRWGGVRSLYHWTWRVELGLAILGASGLALAAVLGADPRGAWLFAAAACGLAVLQTVPAALLAGAQQWRQATIVGLVTGSVAVPATITALALGGGITGFFAVEAVIVLANLVWTGALARRVLVRLPAEPGEGPRARAGFWRFAATSSVLMVIDVVVWRRSEFLFLERYSSDAQIALYSIAFAAVAGLTRIPEVTAKVAMPAVASLSGAGERERIRRGFWRGTRLLGFITPPLAAGAMALGPPALELAYGSAFAEAGDVLLVLLAPFVLLPLLSTCNALLFALGRLRFLMLVGLVATVVNLTLDVLLIPAYDAVGAALASSTAQLVAGLPALVLAVRMLAPSAVAWGPLVRGLVASAATGAAAWAPVAALGPGAGVAIGVPLGVVVFLWSGGWLKILSRDDATWLDESIGGGLHGLVGRVCRRFAAA